MKTLQIVSVLFIVLSFMAIFIALDKNLANEFIITCVVVFSFSFGFFMGISVARYYKKKKEELEEQIKQKNLDIRILCQH